MLEVILTSDTKSEILLNKPNLYTMGQYSFSQKKSSGIFIPKNDGFIELTEPIENTSINGIALHLGYHPDQRICCYFDQTIDVKHVIMEIFSSKILFVLTSDTLVKLDKRKVDYYLRNFNIDKEFDSLKTCDILRDGIENESLNIEFLSRVLNLNNTEPTGIFYAKLLDMYLSFEDGILVDFQYPEGMDEWTKYDEMLTKSDKQQNLPEKFWEAEKRQ